MRIKRFFMFSGIDGYSVIEKLDGTFAKFLDAPFRRICERDLTPVPHYNPVGNREEEMQDYMYRFYGFTKEAGK